MKQKCIRCVVQLTLTEIQWQDSSGVTIHLEGPPLFVRACVLGQLQHSHLHKPTFPVAINQVLTFDRILSNCRNPSLFNEVIRGEHVKIELIQVSPDFKGGKILARFESPVHKFLFPEVPAADGELQYLTLNKSRKYQCPPELSYSSSTTLLEATVQSPVDVIFPEQTSSSASDSAICSGEDKPTHGEGLSQRTRHSHLSERDRSPDYSDCDELTVSALEGAASSSRKSTTSRQLFRSNVTRQSRTKTRQQQHPFRSHAADRGLGESTSAQKRLHTLLSSYAEETKTRVEDSSRSYVSRRVKFKPPVPKFRTKASTCDELAGKDHQSSGLYRSLGTWAGPHEWPCCPRRSPERGTFRSHSAPNSPSPTRASSRTKRSSSPYHRKCVTLPNQVPLHVLEDGGLQLEHLDPSLFPATEDLPDMRPPFVIRHVDDKLMERRDFCGAPTSPARVSVERHTATQGNTDATGTRSSGVGGVHQPWLEDNIDDDDLGSNPLHGTLSQRPYLNENLRLRNEDYGGGDPVLSTHMSPSQSGYPHLSPARNGDGDMNESTLSELYQNYVRSSPRSGSPSPRRYHKRSSSKTRSRSSPPYLRSALKSPHRQQTPHHHSPRRCHLCKSLPSSPVKQCRYSHCGYEHELRSRSERRSSKRGGRARDLVSKYLVVPHRDDGEVGVDPTLVLSPGRMIEEKIQRLKDECCECLRSADSLGEDDLSEDLDRLRASLQGERDETFNRSARLIPDQSMMVQIGPKDYWSKRMSEYTGKRHRVIFDETMEKIYNRLYTDATKSK